MQQPCHRSRSHPENHYLFSEKKNNKKTQHCVALVNNMTKKSVLYTNISKEKKKCDHKTWMPPHFHLCHKIFEWMDNDTFKCPHECIKNV